MINIKKCLLGILFSASLVSVQYGAHAEAAKDLDQLLRLIKQGKVEEAKENAAREQRFKTEKNEQAKMLADAQKTLKQEEDRSAQLEATFEENEQKTAELQEALNKRLGSLKELFGVLQQVAGDTKSQFQNSIVSAQFSNRGQFLDALAKKMGTSSQLASIEEMERLWFELQREMTESGKIVKFNHAIVDQTGVEKQADVIRVGSFNLVADGKYLRYSSETGRISELARQPSSRFTSTAEELSKASGPGWVQFGIDPSRGTLIEALVKEPDLEERFHFGGIVGYIIAFVGAISLLIALEKILTLFFTRTKVKAQMKSSTANTNNPLGRVLAVAEKNKTTDPDVLELKLAEAIIKERPRLERFIPLLKIIAVAAPLLGLLGTVIGMILTFQSITLFGTGDPKLMAGGISQALITTVLGLLVAIPTVFLHSITHGMAKGILQILEEQSAGLIAQRMEEESNVRAA